MLVFLRCSPIQGDIVPSTIRVGLYYNNTAKYKYQLESSTGFFLGLKKDSKFVKLLEIKDTSVTIDWVDSSSFKSAKVGLGSFYDAKACITDGSKFIYYDNGWGVLDNTGGNGRISTSALAQIKCSLGIIMIPLRMSEPLCFYSCAQNSIISLNGKRYRGSLQFLPGSVGGITAVNELDLEEYLYGVLPKEMPAEWPIEALKAQAVAARTYAVSNLGKWEHCGFDLSADHSDQYYGGYDEEKEATNRAVDETKGEIILHEGMPIVAFYHSDSGGITEDSYDVYGKDFPYLKPVKDEFSFKSPYANWTVSFSHDEIENKMGNLKNSVGQITRIYIREKTSSGRVKEVVICGTKGEVTVTGTELRNMLGLNSTLFDVNGTGKDYTFIISGSGMSNSSLNPNFYLLSNYGLTNLSNTSVLYLLSGSELKELNFISNDNFTFAGHGRGHGVGMSQWGARGMAEEGYNYVEILQHYYKNVEIANK